MAYILIVEDELAIAELVSIHLSLAGHKSFIIQNGNDVINYIKEKRPDLIVLDVMLPGRDGFSLIKDIEPLKIPVIFLTAKDQLNDRISGLRMGADDYIVKPFEAIELITRIETVLRRYNANTKKFILNDLEVRLDEHIVLLKNEEVDLTIKEFELLQVLIENKNLALSREKILEMVWGYDYIGETRTVDVHIQRLRKKLNLDNNIKTVYKLGYRLEAPR